MATTTKTDNSTSAKPKISGSITVSARQRGNPILKSIRLAPWEFSDNIVPDYVINSKSAALYLSLKYHTLNPNYVHERLKTFTGFELRILLVQVDISEPHHALKELMQNCILSETIRSGSIFQADRCLN